MLAQPIEPIESPRADEEVDCVGSSVALPLHAEVQAAAKMDQSFIETCRVMVPSLLRGYAAPQQGVM